jgi:hypothetical protein
MNYDASRKQCYTSPTCDKPQSGTATPWETYKLEESEVEPAPARRDTEEVWKKYTTKNHKCERKPGEKPFPVSGMEQCGNEAKELGRKFMNYDAKTKQCYTSETCLKPTKTAGTPWQIYRLEEAEEEVTPAAPTWSKMNEKHNKCERPAGETPFLVASRSDCESKAEKQGRNFLTFDEQGKKCYTSVTCDTPSGPTTVPWQIYQRSAPSALLAHTVSGAEEPMKLARPVSGAEEQVKLARPTSGAAEPDRRSVFSKSKSQVDSQPKSEDSQPKSEDFFGKMWSYLSR